MNRAISEARRLKAYRKTYGEKQREAAAKLGKSVRTIRRLVKKWEEQGLAAIQTTNRADKGKHRIDKDWQKFIINTYKEGNKGSKRINPKQVAIRVQVRANELGQKEYPSYRTVYRVLQPIIEQLSSDTLFDRGDKLLSALTETKATAGFEPAKVGFADRLPAPSNPC